jgi:hypothetical protein
MVVVSVAVGLFPSRIGSINHFRSDGLDMTDEQNELPVDSDDDWQDIKCRCEIAGISYDERVMPSAVHDPGKVRRRRLLRILQLPAGASTRRVTVFPADLEGLRAIEFELYSFLGDYDAIWNKKTGAIEAGLSSDNPRSTISRLILNVSNFDDLDAIAGSENENDGEKEAEEVATSVNDARARTRPPTNWRVVLKQGAASIELSPPSDVFGYIAGGPVRSFGMSVKISGVNCNDYERALQVLQDIGSALTFELDARNNIQLELTRARRSVAPRMMAINPMPARFPPATYPQEPIELYQYGRSASELPLLQFLAYYQVIEFFFPIYSRQEQTRRLRIALKQPKFDVNNDIALNRVLSTIFPEGRGGTSEREQLRLTLRGCLEPGSIREFIESSPEFESYFTAKNQVIRGVGRILLHDGQPDLRDQAADRIYAIRCRVVHAKQESADTAFDLLLPSSPEARSLDPDIELMRLIAQHVIAASGETLHLS